MRRLWQVLTEFASRALAPDEQETVLGDLAECGDSDWRTFCGVFGLAVRRQGADWDDWRPWLALFGLALPLGIMLAFNALSIDGGADLYLWIARNYDTLDRDILEQTGLTLPHGIAELLTGSLRVFAWSWFAGFTLACLSPRTTRVHATAFCLVVGWVTQMSMRASRHYIYSVAGWSLPVSFYTVVLPVVVLSALVLTLALSGMYRSGRLSGSKLRKAVWWNIPILLTGTVGQTWLMKLSGLAGLFAPAAYWIFGCLIVTSLAKESPGYANSTR